MSIIATLVLAFLFVRECRFVYTSWRNGYAPIWVTVGALQAIALIIPLAAVWL